MRLPIPALVLAFVAGVAAAQPLPSAEPDRLGARVAAGGTVRVIAGVAVDTQPEGRIGRAAAARQRSLIRAAQNAAAADLGSGPGARVHALFDTVPHFAAEVDAAGLARLRASRHVRSVQEDVAVPPGLLESTAQIRATGAWAAGRTGSGWTVAVLDTGVDKTHPFLAGKVVSEACYSTTSGATSTSLCPGGVASSTADGAGVNCNTAISGCTHGTHVAGIVAGTNAADGSHGVARGASLIAVQVFSHFPAQGAVMSYSSDQIKGLERVYALRDTYQIAAVNMSLGGGQYGATCDATFGALKAAIDNLRSVGIATVIAAGNNGWRSAISAPACISSAVSVGASCDAGPDGGICATGAGGIASYSNIAPFVSLVAPGSTIASSVPGTGHAAQHGTSMAAPHVAGAWALVKQANPGISVDDALSLLRANATSVNDTRSGGTATDLRAIDLGFVTGTAYALAVAKDGAGAGTVTSAPPGVNCGSDCSELFAEGTTVTLNPSAAAGSAFAGWSGDCTGSGACTLTMSAARSVTAGFAALPIGLGVAKSGTGSGTVTSSPAGIACGTACSATFAGSSTVTLVATAVAGSQFTGWSGACTGTANCTLTMSAARSVTATFAALSYPVSLSKSGTGLGSVTSSPSGINCGSTCSVTRAYGSTLTLTAVPAAGSAFGGWSGACSGTSPTCSITVGAATSVGASFVRTHWPLSLTKAGTGSGRVTSTPAGIDCTPSCSAMMPAGAAVTLTATPADGSTFAGWSGACVGTGTCSVSMSAAKSVSATFTRITHALTVTKGGNGGGTLVSSPSGVSCGTTCSKAFASGTAVSLTPRADTGSAFGGWSGACSGSAGCSVTMDAAKSVGATFTRTHWSLAVTRGGTGTGSVASTSAAGIACGSTCSALMPIDVPVTLEATPAAGSAFGGWSGACSGTGSCTVPMSAAASVGATFTRTHYTIAVTKSGNGAVTASTASIDCGASCSALAPIGSYQYLSATPGSDSVFAGWSGACSGAGPCALSMSANKSVSARFTKITHMLLVSRSGNGTLTSSPTGISCGSTCGRAFDTGTTVTLTARPASGYTFAGWSGACSGTGSCSVAMDAAKSVGAVFATP